MLVKSLDRHSKLFLSVLGPHVGVLLTGPGSQFTVTPLPTQLTA